MPSLLEPIHALTETVLNQPDDLDGALVALEQWFDEYADDLTETERRDFSASLDVESTNDDRSLIDSVLKLHMTRLLYRYDRAHSHAPVPAQNDYTRARAAFTGALEQSEDVINESRIDIAIANAHHLLGNPAANRRWLDRALDRLLPLASTPLIKLAEDIPAMPIPRLTPLKRLGLKFMGFNFERLDQENRDSMVAIARMQIDQIITLAHLLGSSFEVIRERQRAQRAFRVAAHLIVRYHGMRTHDPDQLLSVAQSLQRAEPEAARVLAEQARDLSAQAHDADGVARADALLNEVDVP
jgi:hypothetical protein